MTIYWSKLLLRHICNYTWNDFSYPRNKPAHSTTSTYGWYGRYPSRSKPVRVVAGEPLKTGDTIARISINSEFAAALVATELTHPHLERNSRLQVYKCDCGNYHLQIVAIGAISRDEIPSANTEVANATIVQFDPHRTEQIGGAGAALLRVGPRGSKLIKWGAVALSECKDNIVAEAYEAELARQLYADYVRDCRLWQQGPLTLDTIQGDIKPLIYNICNLQAGLDEVILSLSLTNFIS